MRTQFYDRTEAGKLLAAWLEAYTHRTDVLVLGLPRGGIPVAYEVACALKVPLDICLVRKLGVPEQVGLAMGAITAEEVRVLNGDVLNAFRIPERMLEQVTALALEELKRHNRAYRGDRPQPVIKDRTVILVDDGIVTGATMRSAIAWLKSQQPRRIIVAVPVASQNLYRTLSTEVDQVCCLAIPEIMYVLGRWYKRFPEITENEVCQLLIRQDHSPSCVSNLPNPAA